MSVKIGDAWKIIATNQHEQKELFTRVIIETNPVTTSLKRGDALGEEISQMNFGTEERFLSFVKNVGYTKIKT